MQALTPITPITPITLSAPRAPATAVQPSLRALHGSWRAAAQALLLALTVGGALAFGVQLARLPDHPLADMTHLEWWAQNIRDGGVEAAYAGQYPETYLIYPPGMAHVYRAAGVLADRYPLTLTDDPLRLWLKLIPLAAHAALALTLFATCAAAGGFWRGWLAAALYAWNPGVLFDLAYWGQTDSLPTFLLAAAIGVLFVPRGWWPLRARGRWRLAEQTEAALAGAVLGVLLAAAGLTKPQAWVLLPLVLWLAWRRLGPVGFLGGAIGAAATTQWIVAPWVRSGRTAEMLSVFSNIPQVMPSVSANGHNLWWLKLPGGALSVLDWNPVGGFGPWDTPPLLTFATLGRLGFGLLALLPLLRVTGPLRVRLALAAAGYTAYAYFMTITQVHENHLFAAVPFLAAAAALDFWLLAPFAIASVCFLGNLALHDFLIGDWVTAHVAAWLPWHQPVAIQTANAALNVAGFALFTVIFLRRPFVPRQTAGQLRLRARLVLVAGVAIAGSALVSLLAIVRSGALAQRVWERLAAGAANVGPIEAKLGHKTPLGDLLARAAVDYANLLYTLAGIAAAAGAWAALAGAWWLLCAWRSGRSRENVRTGRPMRAGRPATTATIDVA